MKIEKIFLKDCPFCGSKEIKIIIEKRYDPADHIGYLECESCGIESHYSDCLTSAIELWNQRV